VKRSIFWEKSDEAVGMGSKGGLAPHPSAFLPAWQLRMDFRGCKIRTRASYLLPLSAGGKEP